MKKLSFMLWCLLCTVCAQSQGVVKGRLVFDRTAFVAKGYQVIIVPATKENELATTNASFTTPELQKMNAQVAFTTNEGIYYFRGLRAGRYILKVCTPGGYKYSFAIADNYYRLMEIKDLPPILAMSKKF